MHGDQHGSNEGHLPPRSYGVKLVGKAEVTNPSGTGTSTTPPTQLVSTRYQVRISCATTAAPKFRWGTHR